jgi:hypothetical protein
MNAAPRFIAVFPEASQIPQFSASCRLVVTMMTGNPNFASPMPALTQFTAHLDALDADEQLARKGGKGAVQQRNVSLGLVRNDMRLIKAYVQSVADTHPLTEAESIIHSAGMEARLRTGRIKPPVGARDGKVPGQVVLDAKALKAPVAYRWQMSTDQASWTDLPETFRAATMVAGLTPATTYYFRLRTMTREGLSEWSPVVSIIAR